MTSSLRKLLPLVVSINDLSDFSSKNQYERKFKDWGFRKNLTCEEWKPVLATAKRRKESRKESKMTLNGVLVPSSKIKKEQMRYALSELSNIFATCEISSLEACNIWINWFTDRTSSLPDGICIFTPPPTPGVPEIFKNISFHGLPSFVLMDLLCNSGMFYLFVQLWF